VKSAYARILVDEYQDTSPVQEDVVALLAEAQRPSPELIRYPPIAPSAADAGSRTSALERVELEEGKLFLVGDPKQSIYGFRGADAAVFTRALRYVAGTAAGGTSGRRSLSASRRSLRPIVDLASFVAAQTLPRGPYGVPAELIEPMSALRGGVGAAGEHWRVAPTPEGETPTRKLPPHEQECLVIARRLSSLFDAGELKPADVCVLVRRGKAAPAVGRALARAGIAAHVIGGDGFWTRPEISDVVSALALAADPTDPLAVLTVLRAPLVCATDDDILALHEALRAEQATSDGPRSGGRARQLGWADVARLASSTGFDTTLRERVRAFDAALVTMRRRLHEESLARAVDCVLDDLHYAAACAVEHDGRLRLRNLEKLRAMAAKRRRDPFAALARFTEAIDDPPPEPLAQLAGDRLDAVRVMTIHQSKGLEFPVVVLADAGAGLRGESDDLAFEGTYGLAVTARGRPIAACLPRQRKGPLTAIQRVRQRLKERSEAELARLLYVAMTRARDRLYFVGQPRRAGPGSLLGVFDLARAADPERVDAWLPRVDVEVHASKLIQAAAPGTGASASRWAPLAAERTSVAADGPPAAWVTPAPFPRGRREAAPSELARMGGSQIAFGLGQALESEIPDAAERFLERWSPLEDGRLAHALVATVAQERAEHLTDADDVARSLRAAARAHGVTRVPEELIALCARTLGGPVRRLLEGGYDLSFEEPLVLQTEHLVLDGRADLVARGSARTIVVELKLAPSRGRGEAALLQAAAYASALEAREDAPVAVAVWALGEDAPPPPLALSASLRRRLAEALRALR
jgi:ATP-dependent exoDNAse (exonuclease V) beta subunit